MSTSTDQHPIHIIFDAPELFERVLLHMPIKDLILNVPRVCKEWKQMIETSPSLQRGLFLRPVQGRSHGEGIETTIRVANPFGGLKLNALNSIERDRQESERGKKAVQPSWHKIYMSQPPLYVAVTVIGYAASAFGIAQPRKRTHVIHNDDPTGVKIGYHGSTLAHTAIESPDSVQKWEEVALRLEGWKVADTAADVLQLLGVMDVD